MKYTHYKTGKIYDTICENAILENDQTKMVVYTNGENTFVRPYDEFFGKVDGGKNRFEPDKVEYKEIEKMIENSDIIKNLCRKAGSFEVINRSISLAKYSYISKLKVITSEELGIEYPLGDFAIDTDCWFMLKHNDKKYLVDTEGYSYCRYIVEVVP